MDGWKWNSFHCNVLIVIILQNEIYCKGKNKIDLAEARSK